MVNKASKIRIIKVNSSFCSFFVGFFLVFLLAIIPPILSNALIIPFVLAYVYHIPGGIAYFILTISIGEILSCGVLGMILYASLFKYRKQIFG